MLGFAVPTHPPVGLFGQLSSSGTTGWAASSPGRPRPLPLLGPSEPPSIPLLLLTLGRRYTSKGGSLVCTKGCVPFPPFVELQSSCRPGGGEPCSAEMDSAVQRGCAALPSSRCSGGLGGVLIPPQTLTHPLRTLHCLPLPRSCWHCLFWLIPPKLWCGFTVLPFGEEALHGLVWGSPGRILIGRAREMERAGLSAPQVTALSVLPPPCLALHQSAAQQPGL